MPAGHPLIEDMPGEVPQPFGLEGGAAVSAAGATASGGVTAALETGEAGHQTHLWVAGVIAFAVIGLVVLHIIGFRFATDVGVTRG